MLNLPIGVDDFRKLRSGQYAFVDKSVFIKDILQDGAKAFLIARPRRFGKTINMSMLSRFFDIRDRVENRLLFDGLKVQGLSLADGQSCMEFQGLYPVIFLTFKDLRATNYATMLKGIKTLLSRLYKSHQYLLDCDALTDIDKKNFNDILKGEADFTELQIALFSLTYYLEQYHQKNVILLLDEYDTPLHSAYTAKQPYYDELSEFLKVFLGKALKGNEYLEKGILTGILSVSLMNLFSGLNSLPVRSVFSRHYANCFGFEEGEVKALFRSLGVNYSLDDVRRWYNGYQIDNAVLYNPWSIVNFLDEGGRFKAYWGSTGDHSVLGKALVGARNANVLDKLTTLLEGGAIEEEIDERTIFAHIESNQKALWCLMLFSGYLKPVSERLDNTLRLVSLKIPNFEVKSLFETIVRHWGDIRSVDQNIAEIFQDAINTGNTDKFQQLIQTYIIETTSYYDFNFNTEERFYHIFFLGMMVAINDQFIIDSNKESGLGRYDIAVMPRDKKGRGAIFELKRSYQDLPKDPDEQEQFMRNMAAEALDQINEHQYKTRLVQEGLSSGLHIGIAFCGKLVKVACRVVDY